MKYNVLHPKHSQLNKKSEYDPIYNPEKLFPIPRDEMRKGLGINPLQLPFYGFDLWNHYEVSWLDKEGKPVVFLAEIIYGCDSPNMIESKSMKLYFNSLNNTQFKDSDSVKNIIKEDLEKNVSAEVFVNIIPLYDGKNNIFFKKFDGKCLDRLVVSCTIYTVDPSLLSTENDIVEETLFSDLLKSNCLVTHQPDWGSIEISYKGKKINHEGLLKYIVSFRNHNEFHEQCIERIFLDIMNQCNPRELTVHGRYTRRGGVDINPYRSTNKIDHFKKNIRLCRQ